MSVLLITVLEVINNIVWQESRGCVGDSLERFAGGGLQKASEVSLRHWDSIRRSQMYGC